MAINEERSYTEYNIEVPTTDFPIGFDILDDGIDVVAVTLDDVDPTTLGYTVIQVNNTTYRFAPAVPSGVVRLTRITDIDQMAHVFTEGAIFISENMDGNFKQIRHSQQEVRDSFEKLELEVDAAVVVSNNAAELALEASVLANSASGLATQASADVIDTNTIVQTSGEVNVTLSDGSVVPNMNKRIADYGNKVLSVNGVVGEVVVNAENLTTLNGSTQQEINDRGGSTWYAKSGGYDLNDRVILDNGDEVRSTVANNIIDPNVDMTGWVLYSNEKLRIFNVLDYGADPTGETSSYLAFKKCSTALSSSGSGKYVVPFGIYDCGFQEPPSVGEAWRRIGRYPIDLQELDNVVLDLQGCILKNPDGMYYGNFNADMTPSGPEHKLNAAYRCGTGSLINLVANKVVEITGSATLKGSMGSYIIGGNYGDFGIQIESFGIRLLSNKSFVNNAVIETTDFGEDGVYVADKYKSKAGVWIESTDNTELARHTVSGIRSTFNARQGISFCGGSGAIEDCYIEGIGKTRLTATLPKAGIDVEQEAGVIRDLTINRTTIFDCAGVSFISTAGDSKRILVKDSRFVGVTNYSNYAFNGVFENTWFVGKIGTGGTAETLLTRGDYPTYKKCTFSSRTVDARGLTPFGGGLNIEQIFQDKKEVAFFNDCDFYTTGGWCFLEGLTEYTFKNCKFYVAPETTRSGVLTQFGRSNLIDCEFIDLRESPTTDISISRSNANAGIWENIKVTSTTNRLKFSFVSVGDSFGTLPNNKAVDIQSVIRFSRDSTQALVSSDFSRTASVYVKSSIPTLPTQNGNPFVIGDRILNGLTGAANWIEAACTSSGFTCSTSWVALTNYSINNYVSANGKVYKCTSAGTSGTVAPSHSSGTVSDGSASWEFVGSRAVFREIGVKGVAVSNATATDDTALKLNELLASLKAVGVIN